MSNMPNAGHEVKPTFIGAAPPEATIEAGENGTVPAADAAYFSAIGKSGDISGNDNVTAPRYDIAARHVEMLTGDADTYCHFRLIHEARGATNRSGRLIDLWPQIEAAQRDGWQVFIVVNRGGHSTSYIDKVRALFVDGDGVPTPATWHARPDFLVRRDTTHWHAYWLVADMVPGEAKGARQRFRDAFRDAQKRLVAHYHSDPKVCDLPRIMRLAGSLHLKDPGNPILVTIEGDEHAGKARTAAELLAGLPELVATEYQPRTAPENVDTEWAIENAKSEIENEWLLNRVPAEGERNHTAYSRACRLFELGVPEADALDLLRWFFSHGGAPDEDLEEIIGRVYRDGPAQGGAFGSALPERNSGATMMGGASSVPPGDASDGPVDLWPQDAPEPKLTPDMLPDAPALRYGYNVARRQGMQPHFPVMGSLVVYAAMIHDGIRIQRKGDHLERAHLNITCIDEVGAGKSPTARAMLAPVYKLQAAHAESCKIRLAQYNITKKLWDKLAQKFVNDNQTAVMMDGRGLAGIADRFTAPEPQKPYQKQHIVEDATIESMRDVALGNDGGALNFQDEMSGWLASFDCYRDGGKGGKDQSFWTKTDDGGSYTVNRTGQSWHLPNVGCCHYNHIQPDKLRPFIKTLAGDGFLQRSFPIYGGEEIEEDFDLAVDEEAKAAHERLVEALAALDPNTVNGGKPITVDANINEPWGMRLEVETIIKALRALPSTPGHLKNHLKKYRGKVYRLLLLYHVIECVSRGEPVAPYVSFATAERVKRFVLGFLLPNAIKFYNDFFQGTDGVASDARWIAGYILAHKAESVTLRDLRRANDKMSDAEILSAMAYLQTMRWVGPRIDETAKRSVRWDVDPRAHTMYAERGASEKAHRDAAMEKIREAAATRDRWAEGR